MKWIENFFSAVDQFFSYWVQNYQKFSKKKIENKILNFHNIVNSLQTSAAQLIKKNKQSFQLMKRAFETFFVREETELNKNKETATKTWKKKSKDDKESTEKTDFSTEQEHTSKRITSENHCDDFESKDQTLKRQKCWACSEFHLYKKCYYLFSDLVSENWMTRSEIKRMIKQTLEEDEDFAEKVKKLQNMKKED